VQETDKSSEFIIKCGSDDFDLESVLVLLTYNLENIEFDSKDIQKIRDDSFVNDNKNLSGDNCVR